MIIGIVGLKGAGKDTVGNFICENTDFKKESFANILKDMTSLLFSWDRNLLQGETIESREWREQPDEYWSKVLGREFTPRLALQEIGTQVFRDTFHPDIWVLALQRKAMKDNSNIVITDVRFPNEMKMIKESGGKIIRVERGERPYYWNEAVTYNTTGVYNSILDNVHPSERNWIGLDNPDAVIENNGSLDHLREIVVNNILPMIK